MKENKLNLSEAYKCEILRMTSKFGKSELDSKSEYELKALLDNIVMGKVK
jgi:hypothetical protein